MRIFKRIVYLFLFPEKEWKIIAAENNSSKSVYLKFVVPLLCLMTIATIVGTWINTSRELYSAAFVICRIAILWASASTGLFVSALVANGVQEENKPYFQLIAYSLSATYIVIVLVSLMPFFKEFIVLAFYSFYLFWQGITHLLKVDSEKIMKKGLLSISITVLTHLLMYFLFKNIFNSLIL